MYDLIETLLQLDNIYYNSKQLTEDTDLQSMPPEVRELIAQGVPVLAEEPDFIEEETSELTEGVRWPDSSVKAHMETKDPETGWISARHVALGKQNL